MKLATILGSNIRRYRKQAQLTQEALAEKLNISQNYLGQVERGHRTLSFSTLNRITQVLKVEAHELFIPLGVVSNPPQYSKKRLLKLLPRLSPSQLQLLADLASLLFRDSIN